jgi:hypothetical protein
MSDARSFQELVGQRLARFAAQEKTFEWRAFATRAKEAAGWQCQICKRSGTTRTLSVHHNYYDATRPKWDYELSDVRVLCGECHAGLHERLNEFRRYVFARLTPESFGVINGALSVGLVGYRPMMLAYALAELVGSPSSVERFASSYKGEGQ